ncbi:DUF4190 domain-containing protein [Streptomyces alanosinicus]|uniref:DUF4190 domain-containing protein n=1 Tax=Streptomyces alanosinicus TaxID=68171 RepID=A0A919D3K9_9ACTN|nr:DUF4190 domain-containing protein [Streptomyces alanosinicus]GHE07556.1 hypothetical protein GCM10010339_52760 [Streptomyces alanosinicus]
MSEQVPQSTPQQNQPAGTGPTAPQVSLDKGAGERPGAAQDAIPGSGPDSAAASLSYQQTVTSLPAAAPNAPADAARSAWAPPATGPAPAANPFAPPSATAPAMPYAPPAAPATPYASPAGPYAPPAAQHAGPEPVPPPPVAPDGPGRLPYGYPGAPVPYASYPGQPQPPYAGLYPSANGYGWPGMQPMPSNGMGTAALVLGILAAVFFIVWPVALVLGILAIIFGALGRGKANRGEATNPGMALAGLVCGSSGIVLAVGFIAIFIASRT